MYGQIYIIETTESPKYYVGSTISRDLEYYLMQQRSFARNGYTDKPHLYNAMRQHGLETFTIRTLSEACSEEQLCVLEELWIELLSARDREIGYNVARGGRRPPRWVGENHPMYGKRGEKSPLYGVRLSAEHKENIRKGNLGKPKSPETRAKIAAARRGKPSPMKGVPKSEEHKRKLSEGVKAYFASKKAVV